MQQNRAYVLGEKFSMLIVHSTWRWEEKIYVQVSLYLDQIWLVMVHKGQHKPNRSDGMYKQIKNTPKQALFKLVDLTRPKGVSVP